MITLVSIPNVWDALFGDNGILTSLWQYVVLLFRFVASCFSFSTGIPSLLGVFIPASIIGIVTLAFVFSAVYNILRSVL